MLTDFNRCRSAAALHTTCVSFFFFVTTVNSGAVDDDNDDDNDDDDDNNDDVDDDDNDVVDDDGEIEAEGDVFKFNVVIDGNTRLENGCKGWVGSWERFIDKSAMLYICVHIYVCIYIICMSWTVLVRFQWAL